MDLLFSKFDIMLHLATFLPPEDALNVCKTSKKLLVCIKNHEGDAIGRLLPACIMDMSVKHSLRSVLNQREDVLNASIVDKIGGISTLFGDDQIGIAGSIVVQALQTDGCCENDLFSAGDVDCYCTANVLQLARNILVNDLGLVLVKVSLSYSNFSQSAIHHVESYAFPSGVAEVTTLDNAIEQIPNVFHRKIVKNRLEFLTNKNSKYAAPSNLPYSPHEPSTKLIDLVVTSAGTVFETINRFDFTLCMAFFSGNRFVARDLDEMFQRKVIMRCPTWARLINAYVQMFLSVRPLRDFGQIYQLRQDNHILDCIVECFCTLKSRGYLLPFKDGTFPAQEYQDQIMHGRVYCATLHNMIVKQCHRIVKYTDRGFEIMDLDVVHLLNQEPIFDSDSDSDEDNNPTSTQITHTDIVKTPARNNHTHFCGPAKRVKVLHDPNLSSPVSRAKMRHLDTGGVDTSPIIDYPHNLNR